MDIEQVKVIEEREPFSMCIWLSVEERDALCQALREAWEEMERLRGVLLPPERTEMACRWCGAFSSAQECEPCRSRMSLMPYLVAFQIQQSSAALEAKP